MCCRLSGSVCAAPGKSPAGPAQPLRRETGERSAGRNPRTSAGAGEEWGQSSPPEPATDEKTEMNSRKAVIYSSSVTINVY